MKKFSVCVSTTFDGYVEVDASSHDEEAMELAMELVCKGEIDTLQFDCATDAHYAEEIEK
jgi:hypothetical protein